jgi:hypothetical protein
VIAAAANVIVAAVTDDPNAAPIAYDPPAYVADDHVPIYDTATDPNVENVKAVEFVIDPPDAAFHEHACRAYEPEFAFSLAPVVPGVAVCKLTYGITFVDPTPARPFRAAFSAAAAASAITALRYGQRARPRARGRPLRSQQESRRTLSRPPAAPDRTSHP